ncbi:MAG: thiamine pyrophosphate-binding protein [Pseudomonadota bacterium]
MWQDAVFEELKAAEVRQVAYVPDGGHARLIERVRSDPSMRAVGLTTEEEGIALSAGSWLGGDRCALLMQSSGLGNCVNMLSLIKVCRFPLLMLITMRGEWGEFNPWQVPMGEATPGLLDLAGVSAVRADAPDEVVETVRQAAIMAFDGG